MLLAGLLLAGCASQPPRLEDRHLLAHVELDDGAARIYYRDLPRATASTLLGEVADVRSQLTGELGFTPPRAELVVYPSEGDAKSVRETRCELTRDSAGRGRWVIVFAYPLEDDRSSLLGTTGHEMAEAVVLLRVTVIDPYLRWIHDGVAELTEQRVLARCARRSALANLRQARRFLEERLAAGEEWADLGRWRQLAPWIVRSHRFLGPNQANLSLNDIPGAVARVRQAKALDPELAGGLSELEAMLLRADGISQRGWAPGEARGDDPDTRDFLLYTLSFAVWLEIERSTPGATRAFLSALEARRAAGDHVLSAAEGLALVREACPQLPPVERYPLARALAVLEAEEQRLRGAE
ncbi:MAG TPA: hypothetical protein DEA08_11355 [Planctomycetes bacterium]|nr:hypothetical protein [Planctomycetota bacterium]